MDKGTRHKMNGAVRASNCGAVSGSDLSTRGGAVGREAAVRTTLTSDSNGYRRWRQIAWAKIDALCHNDVSKFIRSQRIDY
jgi:hypothetical protein